MCIPLLHPQFLKFIGSGEGLKSALLRRWIRSKLKFDNLCWAIKGFKTGEGQGQSYILDKPETRSAQSGSREAAEGANEVQAREAEDLGQDPGDGNEAGRVNSRNSHR